MHQINFNTQKNCSAVEQVNIATQDNRQGTESLVDAVEKIKALSKQLNDVIGDNERGCA